MSDKDERTRLVAQVVALVAADQVGDAADVVTGMDQTESVVVVIALARLAAFGMQREGVDPRLCLLAVEATIAQRGQP